MANRKCFSGTDPRISCIACHDPHKDLVIDTVAYDAKCLAGHAAKGATPASTNTRAKACKVAANNCASCHLPEVKLANGLATFHNHLIRIVNPGMSYSDIGLAICSCARGRKSITSKSMRRDESLGANIGSRKTPIDFGEGWLAYKRDGRWRCYEAKGKRRFGRKFVEVTDRDLILELETRGYQILHPAHECIDRPHLPCPACEQAGRDARRRAS